MMKLNQLPHWRWARAKELVDKKLPPRRSRNDDVLVVRAWKYLRNFQKDNPEVEERLAAIHPLIHNARLLYEDIYSGNRWVFEAGVMANQTAEFMAEYLNADVEVLRTYESLFFDVREALAHKGCIIANVLMPVFNGGMQPKDPDFAWKLVAYEGGWEVARSMWEIGDISPIAMDFIKQTFKEQVIKDAREAAFSIVPNKYTNIDMIKAGIDILRLDHEMGLGHVRDQSEAALGALLSSVKVTVRKSTEQLPAEEPRSLPHSNMIFGTPVEIETVDEEEKA